MKIIAEEWETRGNKFQLTIELEQIANCNRKISLLKNDEFIFKDLEPIQARNKMFDLGLKTLSQAHHI